MAGDARGQNQSWPVPGAETSAERRRRQRREYHDRRTRASVAGPEHAKPWNASDARIALDTTLTVPQAAKRVGRSANAVESLRRRWRAGRLPLGLSAHIPDPPRVPKHRPPGPVEPGSTT